MREEVVKLIDVYVVYHTASGVVFGVQGVNLSVKKGSTVILMGPSGSGKSTLLNVIPGIVPLFKGEVRVFNKNPYDLPRNELLKLRRESIGYAMQEGNLAPTLTIYENLVLLAVNKEREDRIQEILEMLRISKIKDRYPDEISVGETKRAGIATALINDPPLIILDEPTADIDKENVERVLEIISEEKKKGKTLIIATHDERLLPEGDMIVNILEGRILEVREL